MTESFYIESAFGAPSADNQFQCDVFMLLPFRENFQRIYEEHIKPVVESRGCIIKRGDDFFSGKPIMHEIWSAIYNAKLIIAECTDRNPNVFYELGMTHTINRPAVVITQKKEDIPFDIQQFRWIEYQDTAEGRERLEHELRNALEKLGVGKQESSYSKLVGQWKVTTTQVQAGTLIADAGRIIDEEWTIVTPDELGRGFYGPYAVLFPNKYRATFYLKIEDKSGSDENLVTIDATSDYAKNCFRRKDLTVGDFIHSNQYQAVNLDFEVETEAKDVEFRLRTSPTFGARKRITFDRVELWASH